MNLRVSAVVWGSFVCGAYAQNETLPPEQARIVEEARAAALNYSRWLPNLICNEVIRRSTDWYGNGNWTKADTIRAQVTYFDRRESYKVTGRNGHTSNEQLENIAGAVSKGEFGSMLRWIFDPAADARFEFRVRETLRGRPVSVFAYRVDAAHSRLELRALAKSVIAGFHGLVYIDDATKRVLRITEETDGPEHFPLRESSVRIDYDWETIQGHRYLVPARVETAMTEALPALAPRNPGLQGGKGRTTAPGSCISCDPPGVPVFEAERRGVTKYRNRVEFSDYREFRVDSKLTFDKPETNQRP